MYHSNPQSIHLSCLCLLFHITLIYLIVHFCISGLTTWYPFMVSYSCIPSFSSRITYLHLLRSAPYLLYSNNTCSSCPHALRSPTYFHAFCSLSLAEILLLPSVILKHQHFHLHSLAIVSPTHTLSPFLCYFTHSSMILCQPTVFSYSFTSSMVFLPHSSLGSQTPLSQSTYVPASRFASHLNQTQFYQCFISAYLQALVDFTISLASPFLQSSTCLSSEQFVSNIFHIPKKHSILPNFQTITLLLAPCCCCQQLPPLSWGPHVTGPSIRWACQKTESDPIFVGQGIADTICAVN